MVKEWLSQVDLMGVDEKWIQAFIEQESSGNPGALRFEPCWPYLYQVNVFSKKNQISMDTETALQRFSYGLGQLMGGVIRELGHAGSLIELLEPQLNIHFMCLNILKIKKSKLVQSFEDVAAAYNGGLGAVISKGNEYTNQQYVISVVNHLKKLKER